MRDVTHSYRPPVCPFLASRHTGSSLPNKWYLLSLANTNLREEQRSPSPRNVQSQNTDMCHKRHSAARRPAPRSTTWHSASLNGPVPPPTLPCGALLDITATSRNQPQESVRARPLGALAASSRGRRASPCPGPRPLSAHSSRAEHERQLRTWLWNSGSSLTGWQQPNKANSILCFL